MPLTPGYGETPLPGDELIALLPHVAELLDKPIRRVRPAQPAVTGITGTPTSW